MQATQLSVLGCGDKKKTEVSKLAINEYFFFKNLLLWHTRGKFLPLPRGFTAGGNAVYTAQLTEILQWWTFLETSQYFHGKTFPLRQKIHFHPQVNKALMGLSHNWMLSSTLSELDSIIKSLVRFIFPLILTLLCCCWFVFFYPQVTSY